MLTRIRSWFGDNAGPENPKNITPFTGPSRDLGMDIARAERAAQSNRERQRRWQAKRRRIDAEARVEGKPDPELPTEPPTADELVDWMEHALVVPTGRLRGQPFRVEDWQRDWLAAAWQPEIREAGLSVARKNGKSGFIAGLLLAHLKGPGLYRGWRGIVTSLTGNLAKELRGAVVSIAEASKLMVVERRSPTPGRVLGDKDSSIDFLAADKSTGHAVSADLALIDEGGLLPEARRELWAAMFSCVSARDGRLWVISIQGDGPMFAELEERAAEPGVAWRRYSAPKDCELNDRDAWRAANPGLGSIKSDAYMEDAAQRAISAPANENYFRAHDLNQDVNPERVVIVSPTQWHECHTDEILTLLPGRVAVGLDVGGTTSMTAGCAVNIDTGAMIARAAFPSEPDLHRRSRMDGVGTRYSLMEKANELRVYEGRSTPVVPFVRDFLNELWELDCDIEVVGMDRYMKGEVEDALLAAGLPITTPLVWRGTGASRHADGSHDVRSFQRWVIDRELQHGRSHLMEDAIGNSELRFDSGGNPALEKQRQRGRIDALSAAVIAVGLAAKAQADPRPQMKLHLV